MKRNHMEFLDYGHDNAAPPYYILLAINDAQ